MNISKCPGRALRDGKVWTIACLFALFFLVLLISSQHEVNLDQPWYLADSSIYYSISLSSQGGRPYVDFEPRYTPGLFYFNALLLNIFGSRMSVVRWGVAAFWLLDLVGLYLVARTLMPRKFAVLASFLGLLWSPIDNWVPWASWYSIPAALFSLFFMVKYVEQGRKRDVFLAGLAAGLSFFFKQSTGAYAIVSLVIVYSVCAGVRPVKPGEQVSPVKEPTAILSLRILGVILCCFAFPLLLMRNYVERNHIIFLLIPMVSLGVFLLALIIRVHRTCESEGAKKDNFRGFFLPPAVAIAAFLCIAALWLPIATRGVGVVKLINYLLMLGRPEFVYAGSVLRLTPPASLDTFAPVAFYWSLGLVGAILFLRAKAWLRILLVAATVAAAVTAILLRPALTKHMFSQLSGTSACMVFVLHFAILLYLLVKNFSRDWESGKFRETAPLLAVLVFSEFFFLQLFPLNSFIHLRWALNAWLILAAWAAYAFYEWVGRLRREGVQTALSKSVRYVVAVAPIVLYFSVGILVYLFTVFFHYGFVIGLMNSEEPYWKTSDAWLNIHARADVVVSPRQLVQPDLERVDVSMPANQAWALEALVKYIKSNTGPQDFVFGPNLNFINFAADIPSPLSENYFFPGWVNPEEEIEMRRQVAIYRPKFVIFFESDDLTDVMGLNKFRKLFPNLAEYLESRYVDQVKIGPFRVARRK